MTPALEYHEIQGIVEQHFPRYDSIPPRLIAVLADAAAKKAKTPLTDDQFEAVLDAARPLFLGLESNANTIEGMRESIRSGGHDISYLPLWFRTGTGWLSKEGRACLAYHMFEHAKKGLK
jgi:hypothetical protein